MIYDEIEAAISEGYHIHCETKEETQNATNMLLKLGYVHGTSGYSKRYAEGNIGDELRNSRCYSWYAAPFVHNGMVEYGAMYYYDEQIEYSEFENYYNFKMGISAEDGTEIRCDMKQLFALL